MKKRIPLILEQLEDRIFLDANPLMVADAGENAPAESAEELAPVSENGEVDSSGNIAVPESGDVAANDQVEEQGNNEVTEVTAGDEQEGEAVTQSQETVPEGSEQASDTEDVPVEELSANDEIENDNLVETADTENTENEQSIGLANDTSATENSVEVIDPLIGEQFTFTVTLDNTTSGTLYGPYIDLYFESGSSNAAGDEAVITDPDNDGIIFDSATYLGTTWTQAGLQSIGCELVYDGSTPLLHPYAVDSNGDPVEITTNPDGSALQEGDAVYVLQMPFGSYTPGQAPAPVVVTAHISEFSMIDLTQGASEDLSVQVSNGFQFGTDELQNPAADPSITNLNSNTKTFRPEVLSFEKDYSGPEQETATGPNYPRQYTIQVDIADGQTITALTLTDLLPDEIYFLGVASVVDSNGVAVAHTDTITSSADQTANPDAATYTDAVLKIVLDAPITGTSAATDLLFTFDFYIPEFYLDGVAPILGGTCNEADTTIINDAKIEGDWTPTDSDDEGPHHFVYDTEVNLDTSSPHYGEFGGDPSIDEQITAKSFAIQKDVAMYADTDGSGGFSPGDIVRYDLKIQISDYLSFGDLEIVDTMSDGLTLYTTTVGDPSLSVVEKGVAFAPTTFDNVGTLPEYDSTTVLQGGYSNTEMHFHISNAMLNDDVVFTDGDFRDGVLEGGHTGTLNAGPTTMTITYYAVINNDYTSVPAPGDLAVDQGDILHNAVTASGNVYGYDGTGALENNPLCPEDDTSSAEFQIDTGTTAKDIFKVNGIDPPAGGHIAPGDDVTFRLTYTLPTGDVEHFSLTDYLPKPVFDALSLLTFDAVQDATLPALGHAKFGANDTFFNLSNITPGLTQSASENSIVFNFGDYDASNPLPGGTTLPLVVEILFTVEVSNSPFADGMYLTNMLVSTESGTEQVATEDQDIAGFTLDQPELNITKGVVEAGSISDITEVVGSEGSIFWSGLVTDPTTGAFRFTGGDGIVDSADLLANPIDDNLTGADAYDYVTYAIVIENEGHFNAFDIVIDDALPTGHTASDVSNIRVTDGNGNVIDYTGNLFDGTGIELDDSDWVGGLGLGNVGNTAVGEGNNIAIITYDLLLSSLVAPTQTLTNTASLTHYTSSEGYSESFVDPAAPLTDDATVTTTKPDMVKTLVSTEIVNSDNTNSEAVIGETVTYDITVTFQEGTTPDSVIVDTLDAGLVFGSLISVTPSTGVTTTIPGGFAGVTESVSGQNITFDLGTITNSDDRNSIDDTVVLTYTAYVSNVSGNQAGTNLNNTATFSYTNADAATVDVTDTAGNVTVIEPSLDVSKTVVIDGAGTTGDAGDTVVYTITISNGSGAADTDAFDVSFSDIIPDKLVVDDTPLTDLISVTDSTGSGLTAADFIYIAGTRVLSLKAGSNLDIETGEDIIITITGTLDYTVSSSEIIKNTANIQWQSLDDNVPHIHDSTGSGTNAERTGDGGINDYVNSAVANITIEDPSVSKHLISTEIDNATNSNTDVVIGEEATYEVTITLKEGLTPDAVLVDTLDLGLTYIDGSLTVESVSADLSTDNPGGASTGAIDTGSIVVSKTDSDQKIHFDFGTISNLNSVDAAPETITIRYTVFTSNIIGNQSGVALTNEADLYFNNNIDHTGAVSAAEVKVIEPELEVLKSVIVNPPGGGTTGDAGDNVEYTIVIKHAAGSETDAFDVDFSDDIPVEIIGATVASITDTTGTLGTGDFSINASNVLTLNSDVDLSETDTITIVITGSLATTVTPSQIITNEAKIQWQSLDDNPRHNQDGTANERTGVNGVGGLNDYVNSDTVNITITGNTVEKILVNSEITDEAPAIADGDLAAPNDANQTNSGREVVIGEKLSYELTITLAEGDSDAMHVFDTHDPGLSLVSIDALILSDPAKISGTNIVALQAAIAAGLNDPTDSGDVVYTSSASGSDTLDINLGNVENSDTDNLTAETITIKYTVMVTDIPASAGNGQGTAGTQLDNGAQLKWTDHTAGVSVSTVDLADSVEILEPELLIEKTRTVDGPGDAGDIVTYTITVNHDTTATGSESTAYDISLADIFEADIDPAQLVLTSAKINGVDVTGFSISGNQLLTATPHSIDLDYGSELVVVISATLAQSVNPADTVENRVDLTWTSMDGDRSDYSGFVSSGEDQERDYSAFDDAPPIIVPSPTVTKVFSGTDMDDVANSDIEATIGEIITYTVTIDLTEGTTNSAQVVDSLGLGLEFVDASITGIASGSNVVTDFGVGNFSDITGSAVGTGTTGQTITFDLGNLTILGDNGPNGAAPDQGADQVIITYRAVVVDITANDSVGSGAETFSNSVVFNYDNDAGSQSTGPVHAADVTLVEPDLETIKTINGLADGTNLLNADAGDVVTYEITLQHTGLSGSGAYDVTLSDDLPDKIDFLTGGNGVTAVFDSAGVLTTTDFLVNTVVDSNGVLQIAIGGNSSSDTVDIQKGRIITITLTGILRDTVNPNEDICNTDIIDWTSLPSTHENNDTTNERGSLADDVTIYQDSDDVCLSIGTPDIDKQGGGTYTIGEDVDFDIVVNLREGTTNNLIVTDLLPAGLVIDDPTVGNDITITTPAGMSFTEQDINYSGNTLTIDLGTAVVDGDNDTTNNAVTITITARVENIVNNHDTVTLTNQASMTYTGGSSGPDSVIVTIVEPKIETTKVITDTDNGVQPEDGTTQADLLGDIFTAKTTFTNSGSSDAYELIITDHLAPGTKFDPTSIAFTTVPAGWAPLVEGTNYTLSHNHSVTDPTFTITITDSSLALASGAVLGLDYKFSVQDAWFVEGTHCNLIDANWSSMPGTPAGERVYDDTNAANPGMSMDSAALPEELENDKAKDCFTVPAGDGSLGDFVFYDINNNGLMDIGTDIGIPDVQVITSITLDAGLPTERTYTAVATTGHNGEYHFTHLHGADYTVTINTVTLPSGATQIYEGDGSLNNSIVATVPNSGSNLNADFGYIGDGKIGDFIWYDVNNNGLPDDSRYGINGATVQLEADLDGDGTYEYTITTTTVDSPTGDPGYYVFENLLYSDYRITVTALPGDINDYTQTADPDTVLDSVGTVASADWAADADKFIDNQDFGYIQGGSIGDSIWDDLNADKLQAGESGIGGVRVVLSGVDLNHDGTLDTLSTFTVADGSYRFAGLIAGTYTITVDETTLPAGYIQTYDYQWNAGGGDGLNSKAVYALTTNEVFNDIDFGYTKTGSIGDTVWFDANANTVQDSGEPGLSGVQVTLTGDVDLDGVIDTLTTVTDATGQYLFDDLPTGMYDITVDPTTLPGGMRQTYDADGIVTADTTNVNLGYGENNKDTDFGYTGTGSIGDTVWYDANRNGLQDGGESGIANVLMTLDADINSDGVVDYTIAKRTDGSGRYLFENLPAGRYAITLDPATLPPNLTQTYDPDSLMDGTSSIALGAGDNNLAQDFAYGPPEEPPTPAPPIPEPPQPFFPQPPDIFDGDDDENHVDAFLEGPALSQSRPDVFQPALTTMPTMYTGHAEPGTMLHLTMYDAQGNVLATHMAPADTGGNWLANFQVAPDSEMPHKVVIQQSAAVYNRSTEGGFNLRTNFSPSFGSKAVTSVKGDVSSVMGGLAERVVEDLHRLYNGRVDVRWDSTSPYESTVNSTNPGQGSTL